MDNVTQLITTIKSINPSIPIILGGPHPTLFPQKILEETQADISIQGDGEPPLDLLVQSLHHPAKRPHIPGAFYKENTSIHQGTAPHLLTDLTTVPFPNRELTKPYTYGKHLNPYLTPGEFTSIVTSRGCPYRCTFCSRNSIAMKKFRSRPTDHILKELEEIHAQGYTHLSFTDDCFLSNAKQAHELFDAIIERQFQFTMYITAARVDSADRALYEKMKTAGVKLLQFGLESGTQEVLDFYQKQTTPDQIRHAVTLSHRIGFFTAGSFIFGAPFETKQQMKQTLSFACSLPLNSVSFLPLMYMAGSPLWEAAVTENKIKEDEYCVLADADRTLGQLPTKELLRYCYQAQVFFYSRPKFYWNLLQTCKRQKQWTFLAAYVHFLRP